MKYFIALCLCLTFILNTASAQDSGIVALRIHQSPLLDGNLNDEAWKHAMPFSGLKMIEPYPGNEPGEKTEIRVIYDNNLVLYKTNMERRWSSNPRFVTKEEQLRFKVQLSIRI